jgi:hypothetical protein
MNKNKEMTFGDSLQKVQFRYIIPMSIIIGFVCGILLPAIWPFNILIASGLVTIFIILLAEIRRRIYNDILKNSSERR